MPRAAVYSFSKLKCFEQCRFQFAQRYYHKSWPRRQSIEAYAGSRVHSVVEEIHKGGCQASPAPAWDLLLQKWNEDEIERKTFDVREYGEKWWREHAMRCVSNYLRIGQPPPGCMVTGIEYRLGAPLSLNPMMSLTGILDRLVVTDEDAYEIHDFKTGKRSPRHYFVADHQLPLYAGLVAHHFGVPDTAPILCRRIYLGPGEIDDFEVTGERRAEARDWALRTAFDAQAFLDEFDGTAPTRAGKLCDWCVLKNAGCPAFTQKEDGDAGSDSVGRLGAGDQKHGGRRDSLRPGAAS